AILREGTVIRGKQNDISYTITETKPGAAGAVVKFAISCDLAGEIGNLDSGAVFNLISPLVGIGSIVAAEGGISGGLEAESDDLLRNRLQLRINNPIRIGRKIDFEYWAIASQGVTRAWCLPWRDGNGGMAATGLSEHKILMILADYGREDLIPTANAIALANANILNNCQVQLLPVCAAVQTVPVPIRLSIQPDNDENRAAVARSLKLMYRNFANLGEAVPISKILTAIATVPGINYFNVISPTEAANNNPVVSPVQIHVCGQVTFQ
ncbi:MAG: baseplate J/gp47 family protein, partial [Alphaproteobacteria bacterium]|nr:baseplate J/gp47 family protein [Alphaproteobacteria bacterium]